MSPYPAQVDRERIVTTAWDLIEAEGLDRLSLNKLARKLGIKAPSLYNHIENKTGLLRAVNELTMERLMAHLGAAVTAAGDDLTTQLFAIAYAAREYAHAHQDLYLLLNASSEEVYPDLPRMIAAVSEIETVTMRLAGPEHAMNAMRGLWALTHGFIMLEIAGHFRREESFEDSWRSSLEAYFFGWRSRPIA